MALLQGLCRITGATPAREPIGYASPFTPLGADGFYWKVKATEEGLGENWPFQPPIVFGADGTAETEDEARRHLETALALYRSRYLSPGGM